MAQTETSRTASSPRPGIAVEWKAPQSATNYWTQDRMHFPDAVGPLTVSFEGAAFNVGSGRAFAEYSIPARMRMAVVNGYLYSTDEPVSADPAVMGEAGKQAEVRIKAASARLREAWENETLPELESDVAVLRAFNYAGASDSALADHLDWLVERRARHWYLHFTTVVPMFGPIVAFEELYRSLLTTADDTEPYRLLEGLPSRTIDGGHALWRLSRLAATSPRVREAIEQSEPDRLFERLEQSPEGRAFADAFRAYLDEYGWRGDSWNMDDRTWVSYPRTPQSALRRYLAQPDSASPENTHVELARQRAIAAARERLAGSRLGSSLCWWALEASVGSMDSL